MNHQPFTILKVVLIAAIVVFLVVSVLVSLQSFTGYVISEKVNVEANILAFAFFLTGVLGAVFYLRKFRNI